MAAPKPDRRTLRRVSRVRNSDRLHENWYRRNRSPSVLASNERRAACWTASASARWRWPAASVSSRAIARSATPWSTAIVANSCLRADRPTGGRACDRSGRRGPGRGCGGVARGGSPTARGSCPSAVFPAGGWLSPSQPSARSDLGREYRGVRSSGQASTGSRQPWIRGGGRWPRGGRGRREGEDRIGLSTGEQGVEDFAPKGGVGNHIAIAEEPAAQGGGLFPMTIRLLRRHGLDDPGEPGDLGALGPFQPPGRVDGLLDQQLLDLVLGLKLIDPGLEPDLKDVGILIGQDEGFGGHAMLHGIEPGSVLALGRPGPGALLSVAAVDRGAIDRAWLSWSWRSAPGVRDATEVVIRVTS